MGNKTVTSNKKTMKMSKAAIDGRIQRAVLERARLLLDVSKVHVKVTPGNRKTGRNVYTVSLIPGCDCCAACEAPSDPAFEIAGCKHNGGCKYTGCYDIQNVLFQPNVQKIRAMNSAVHKADPERYWREIAMCIDLQGIEVLRVNVGGDLTDRDFDYLGELAESHPYCEFQFFTKNYDGANRYLAKHEGKFPKNVYARFSIWPGIPYSNPHGVRRADIVWDDGTTTLPIDEPAIYCPDNCSVCHQKKMGCFSDSNILLFGH